MRQEWSPQPPGCVKSASRMVPPAPGCVKNASRMVPPAPGVRKLRQDWSTSVSQFSRKPGLCENCSNTGPPVLLQFSHVRKLRQDWSTSVVAIFAQNLRENCDKTGPPVFRNFRANPGCAKTAATLVHQCCCNFRTCENCDNTGPNARKVQQHWFDLCENCVNTGPPCAKSATTLGAKCAKSVSGFKYYRYIWFRV